MYMTNTSSGNIYLYRTGADLILNGILGSAIMILKYEQLIGFRVASFHT